MLRARVGLSITSTHDVTRFGRWLICVPLPEGGCTVALGRMAPVTVRWGMTWCLIWPSVRTISFGSGPKTADITGGRALRRRLQHPHPWAESKMASPGIMLESTAPDRGVTSAAVGDGEVCKGAGMAVRRAVKGCRYQVSQEGERNARCCNFDSKPCLVQHRDEALAGTVTTILSAVAADSSGAARATRRSDWREQTVKMTNRGAGQATTTSRLLGSTWRPRASIAFARCPSTGPRSMTST